MRIGFHRGSRDTPLINITQAESAITTRAGYRHKERPSILPLHPSVRQRLECRRLRKQIRGLVCFSVGAPGSGANIILTNGLEHAQPELWILRRLDSTQNTARMASPPTEYRRSGYQAPSPHPSHVQRESGDVLLTAIRPQTATTIVTASRALRAMPLGDCVVFAVAGRRRDRPLFDRPVAWRNLSPDASVHIAVDTVKLVPAL